MSLTAILLSLGAISTTIAGILAWRASQRLQDPYQQNASIMLFITAAMLCLSLVL